MDQEQDTVQNERSDEQPEPLVRIEQLSKSYPLPIGRLHVLQAVSF